MSIQRQDYLMRQIARLRQFIARLAERLAGQLDPAALHPPVAGLLAEFRCTA